MVLRRRDGRGCQQWYYAVGMAGGVNSGITS